MLSHLVDTILNLPPEVLGRWGYAIVFLFSITESLPLIGLVIPGGVIVIATGFFVKMGILGFIPSIIIISVGAFIGDSISYLLGRRFGYGFLVKIGKYIFFKEVHFEKAKKVLQDHPRKALLGGRFHALTRCVMPFAAGCADVKPLTFFSFAGISAVVWATANVLIGFIFGQGFEIASKYIGTFFFIALGLSVVVVYSYQFISRFTERNKHIIKRYQIYPLLINLTSIYFIAKLAESVVTGQKIHRADVVVQHFFQKMQTPFLTNVFVFITALVTPTNVTIVGCVLAGYFMYRRRWYFLALLPSSLLAGIVSFTILKKALHIPRPLFPLVTTTDFSFPSGHATLAVIFFGLIIYFFKDSIKSILWRRVYVVGCVVSALLVCLSRLYLNAHWFSDVLTGMVLGIFWITFFIVLFYFFTSISPRRMEKEFEKEI